MSMPNMPNMPAAPLWAQALVGILLVASGLFALLAGYGLMRLPDCFQRMHPPSLVTTGAAWCTSLAAIVYFSALHSRLSLKTWLIIILLAITVPISTLILARAALFRRSQSQDPTMPAPLATHGQEPTPGPPGNSPVDQ
ncbi:MAG: monovalent cation/H(+) antiporter subunit G [Brachymonas sp.]|nr:monovalent cation/H(+) antiporter subunit G [Brachymonas sp.]